jgi:hypothetical protein
VSGVGMSAVEMVEGAEKTARTAWMAPLMPA